MVTTETLLPIWAGTLALIGSFFGMRAALRRRKARKAKKEGSKQR